MDKTFENLKNTILNEIKGIDWAINIYTNDLQQPDLSYSKHKKLEHYIDQYMQDRITLELILRKFYTWDEIRDMVEN
jgi:hypothetical protein